MYWGHFDKANDQSSSASYGLIGGSRTLAPCYYQLFSLLCTFSLSTVSAKSEVTVGKTIKQTYFIGSTLAGPRDGDSPSSIK